MESCLDPFLMQQPGLQSGLSRKVSDHKAEDPRSQIAHTLSGCLTTDSLDRLGHVVVQSSERCLVLRAMFQSLCVAALVFSARPFSAEDFFGKRLFCQGESTAVAFSKRRRQSGCSSFSVAFCRGLVLV